MRPLKPLALLLACAPCLALAQPGPGDRVYTGDQTSNTVSVIDPATDRLLGMIRLGEPVPASLGPLYKGQLLTHGLGFSPDGETLVAVSIGSNGVTFIDTRTNAVRGTTYVGRSPHEAFFTPDGREVWVSVRGEDYVAVLDAETMRETHRVQTAPGPGMVMFSPDGAHAFVVSSFTPELSVIEVETHTVVAKVPQVSPFSPNLDVSDDGNEVWLTLKDTGKVQIIGGRAPFETRGELETGPITNHVQLVDTPAAKLAYVSVGGENALKVYSRDGARALLHTIELGALPHGLWPSPDGRRLYVGLENGDAVQVVDTATQRITATIPVGQLPQAVVYVPGAAGRGAGTDNLIAPDEIARGLDLTLAAPAGAARPEARASVVVNRLGLVDQIQIAATGLVPDMPYQLVMEQQAGETVTRVPLAPLKVNAAGTAIAQAIGPVRRPDAAGDTTAASVWRLVVQDAEGNAVLEPVGDGK